MTAKLSREDGKACYAKRKQTTEPVFGQFKQQGARRFLRRGTAACQAEWKLLCGTHNLLKLWRHTAIQQGCSSFTGGRDPQTLAAKRALLHPALLGE
jgi:hypothetical protein